ncbi:MAG: type II 3-dehydroquinate dehydratase [Candidatus Omnitrophica bacterium]|nr:type II 3-dehydroquinate dehydratase [Candidatus Omnitrophota bacterium]
MLKILVIHGPNLDLLGRREPEVYGKVTLKEINDALEELAKSKNVALTVFQSNHEGEIVSIVGKASAEFNALLINPAAYTHTSVAIRDAILSLSIPVIEVHLSNIYAREEFRSKSLISPVVKGGVYGFGLESYILGLNAAIPLAKQNATEK